MARTLLSLLVVAIVALGSCSRGADAPAVVERAPGVDPALVKAANERAMKVCDLAVDLDRAYQQDSWARFAPLAAKNPTANETLEMDARKRQTGERIAFLQGQMLQLRRQIESDLATASR